MSRRYSRQELAEIRATEAREIADAFATMAARRQLEWESDQTNVAKYTRLKHARRQLTEARRRHAEANDHHAETLRKTA